MRDIATRCIITPIVDTINSGNSTAPTIDRARDKDPQQGRKEARMGRRLDLMGRKVTDVLAKMEVGEREEAQLVHDVEPKEQLVFTGPADWTPDQAEQYIDWRIHQVDQNVAKLRQQLGDQIAMRRRWLAVTDRKSVV